MTIFLLKNFYGMDITKSKTFKAKNLKNKMKRGMNLIVILSILLLSSLSLVMAIELPVSVSTIDSTFTITGLRYEPYPVSPGEQFDVWIKVDNKETQIANNATCILKPDYPFSIYQGDSQKSYGKLNPGDSIVFQFSLKADQNASQGSNELQVWCIEDPASGSWKVQKINILIQTRYPTLNIKEIKTQPEAISPGKDAVLLFTLENLADSAMKDIDIKLNLSSDITSSGEVAEKKLRMIEAGGIADLMFNIKAMPGSKGGIYQVPFTLTYTDNLGTPYVQEGLISIGVSSKPELIVSVDSTAVSKSVRIGDVDIKITNSGLTNLKFATVEIMDSDKFKILSSNVVYIGDIDSDDFGTATFKLSVKTSKDFDIPLKISFRDALNNDYSENVNVKLMMLSSAELGNKSPLMGTITTLVILFLVLVLLIKSWRQKAKNLIFSIFKKK